MQIEERGDRQGVDRRARVGVATLELARTPEKCRVDEAAEVLDGLGEMNPFNDELTALRDKANLALGYALLAHV